jgi:hypothetical protein
MKTTVTLNLPAASFKGKRRKMLGRTAQSRIYFSSTGKHKNMAGYSGKSLIEKLGLKEGQKVLFLQTPPDYQKTLGEVPPITFAQKLERELDFIHLFTKDRKELKKVFPQLKEHLADNGMIWISWPKKASKIPTDLDENGIREIGLSTGLVDVKVCAVDDIWSGLKFVIRLKDRNG